MQIYIQLSFCFLLLIYVTTINYNWRVTFRYYVSFLKGKRERKAYLFQEQTQSWYAWEKDRVVLCFGKSVVGWDVLPGTYASEWQHILVCRLYAAIWAMLAWSCVFSSIIACIWASLSQYWGQRRNTGINFIFPNSFFFLLLRYWCYLLWAKLSEWPVPPWQKWRKEWRGLIFTVGEKRLKSFSFFSWWFFFNFLYGFIWRYFRLSCCVMVSSYWQLEFFRRKPFLRILVQNGHNIWY